MNIEVVHGSLTESLCDTLIVSLFQGVRVPGGVAGTFDKALNGHIRAIIRDLPGCGKYGETTVVHTLGNIAAKRIILLGLGKETEFSLDKSRAVMAIALRSARKLGSETVA
ncbi:MAG: M17 family peptidase N-terminal domain-containing protein, partial [Sporomusa sp.]